MGARSLPFLFTAFHFLKGIDKELTGSSQRTEQLIIVQREDEALAEGQSDKDDSIS